MKTRRVLTRILLGIVALIAASVLVLAGVILYDSAFPAQRVTDLTNVTYPGPNGVTLHGYLARPTGNGPHPAVLMIHEFYGLNQDIIRKADLLAGQGYVVLAADSYRGQTTALIPRAIFLVATTPQDRIASDLDAAFRYLSTVQGVDALRVGAVGFCFGGTQVMKMGTRNGDLAAAVIFYGSGPITDPAALGVMGKRGPVLGIYGERDQSIPLAEVRGFELALQARGIPHRVMDYPGVGHAFVTSASLAQPGAARQAWVEMLAFLAQNLKGQAMAEFADASAGPVAAPTGTPGILSALHRLH
jgi:carboxymethylenebutenolidase